MDKNIPFFKHFRQDIGKPSLQSLLSLFILTYPYLISLFFVLNSIIYEHYEGFFITVGLFVLNKITDILKRSINKSPSNSDPIKMNSLYGKSTFCSLYEEDNITLSPNKNITQLSYIFFYFLISSLLFYNKGGVATEWSPSDIILLIFFAIMFILQIYIQLNNKCFEKESIFKNVSTSTILGLLFGSLYAFFINSFIIKNERNKLQYKKKCKRLSANGKSSCN